MVYTKTDEEGPLSDESEALSAGHSIHMILNTASDWPTGRLRVQLGVPRGLEPFRAFDVTRKSLIRHYMSVSSSFPTPTQFLL